MACKLQIQGTVPEYLEIQLWFTDGTAVKTIQNGYTVTAADLNHRGTFICVHIKDEYKEQYEYPFLRTNALAKYWFICVGYNNDAHQVMPSNSLTEKGSYCSYMNCCYKEIGNFYLNNNYNMLFNFEDASLLPDSKVPLATQYKLTQTGTLNHCTCNYEVGTVLNVGDTIRLTSDDWFTFLRADNKSYTLTVNGAKQVMNTNISSTQYYPTELSKVLPPITQSEGEYAIVDLSDDYITQSYTGVKVYITNRPLKNCTCNYTNNTDYIYDKPIILTADEGWEWGAGPYQYTLQIDSRTQVSREFTISQDKKTLTAKIADEDLNTYQDVYLNANVLTPISEIPTAKYTFVTDAVFENCACNFNDGDTINVGDTLQITAESGFEFVGDYTFTINGETTSFRKNSDKTVLSYIFTKQPQVETEVKVTGTITATREEIDVVAFTSIYNPSDTELDELTKHLIVVTSENIVTDYSSYISKLYIIPFDVSSLRLPSKKNIILRNYDTTTQSYILNHWKMTVNGGQITIPNKYENVYDFINTTCQVYIPYFDIVSVEPKYIIGQTVSIQYILNFYDGYLCVNLSSTLNDKIFFTDKIKASIDIPFSSPEGNFVENEINVPKLESVFQPYVTVTRNIPKPVDGTFGKRNHFYSKLKDLNGWTVVEDIDLDIDIPSNEENELKSILKGGVFI